MKVTTDVLIVDDSALTRQLLSQVLSAEPGFTVRTASDPILAEDKIKQRRPDVLLLDLEMPRMSGLDFLRKLMAEDPIPVVVCSAFAAAGAAQAESALAAGALHVVPKPENGLRRFLEETSGPLVDILRRAGQTRVTVRAPAPESRRSASVLLPPPAVTAHAPAGALIVIGASAGGTDALPVVLQSMPEGAPPIAVVLHMRADFMTPFAARLDASCPQRVRVAESGDLLESGTVLLAPGGRHLVVARRGVGYAADVVDGPPVSRHRPSVDVLFRAAATAAGRSAVAILLTGMGDDGATGMVELRTMGAHTIAQDEATCLVFGMPREAIARGGVDTVASLDKIGAIALRAAVSRKH